MTAEAAPTVTARGHEAGSFLVVSVADARCGFPISAVEEVVPAARLETLPGAPDVVMGVLDLRGAPIVVIDGRACVAAQPAPMLVTDRFVVLAGTEPKVAIRVDAALDVSVLTSDDRLSELPVHAGGPITSAVALLPDGLLLVTDPHAFTSAGDAVAIRLALERFREAMP